MFIPLLAAASVAAAFAQVGALSTKVAVLTGSLYAVILIAIVLALWALSPQQPSHRRDLPACRPHAAARRVWGICD